MYKEGSYFPEVFDSSMVATLKACPQLFKKIYIDQWKSKSLSIHLHAGGCFAKGVEVARTQFFVHRLSAEESVAEGLAALLQSWGDFDSSDDEAKSLVRMAGALVFYFDMYPLTHETAYPILLPGGRRAIEFSFAHPLPIKHPVTSQPILYCGRMDAILAFAGDQFLFDEKTTGSLGKTWSQKWDLRAQFTGYVWGCREAGVRVAGAVVRGVSILKTEYQTQEVICSRPEWQVDRWYSELLEWIGDAIRWWESGRFRYNLDESCARYGGCGFAIACKSQDETSWLSTFFEKRHWDPITRLETKLP